MRRVNSVTIRRQFFVLVKVLVQIFHPLSVCVELPFVFKRVVDEFDQKNLHPFRSGIKPVYAKLGIIKLLVKESSLNEIKWLDPRD